MSMHPTRNLFAEFKGNHRIFVETGSYRGDGIQLALHAGFEKIISIDIDPANIEFCRNRFDLDRGLDAPEADIQLYCGDSAALLGKLIADINEPCMFWLDAHAQHLEGEEEGPNPYPLFDELKAIGELGMNGNTIFIDDILHLTHCEITGWELEQIVQAASGAVGNCKNVHTQRFANPVKNSILMAWGTD